MQKHGFTACNHMQTQAKIGSHAYFFVLFAHLSSERGALSPRKSYHSSSQILVDSLVRITPPELLLLAPSKLMPVSSLLTL